MAKLSTEIGDYLSTSAHVVTDVLYDWRDVSLALEGRVEALEGRVKKLQTALRGSNATVCGEFCGLNHSAECKRIRALLDSP